MPKIQKLPLDVVNQIAAGEVVERPASIVKELVENSIDAGADIITVKITAGGIDKIEIHDNGEGIEEGDLEATFERFATSKLKKTEDLSTLYTFGFRGEALASISSVSKVTLTSRHKSQEAGYTVISEFGELRNAIPKGRSIGTTITVEQLFNNIPARLKFLKTPETEFRYILEIFQDFALTYPHISFSLVHNEREIYNLSSKSDTFIKRVALFFKQKQEELLLIEHSEFGIDVKGVVMHPRGLTTQSRFQRLFVNNRIIEDKGLARAAQKGMEEYVPFGTKPSFVLFVTTDPTQVDVNVHPRKIEVKFLNPFRVFQAIQHAVKNALVTTINQEMHVPTNNPMQYYSAAKQPASSFSSPSAQYSTTPQTYPAVTQKQTIPFTAMSSESIQVTVNEDQTAFQQPDQSIVSVMAVLSRYLIVEWERELWIVDQHAAAERIRFERLKKRLQFGSQFDSQSFLTPQIVYLSEQEKTTLLQHFHLFTRLGIEIEITEQGCQVKSLPHFLSKVDIDALVHDILTELTELIDIDKSPEIDDFAEHHNMSLVIATMACHSSIRMNERVSKEDAMSLIRDLLACDIPYACPHGRPVFWKLSNEEIDRHFMR